MYIEPTDIQKQIRLNLNNQSFMRFKMKVNWYLKGSPYPYPEKKCNLKSILEKDEMNQEEDKLRSTKPKVFI